MCIGHKGPKIVHSENLFKVTTDIGAIVGLCK